eukprot:1009020-Rhodomonas_salina.2
MATLGSEADESKNLDGPGRLDAVRNPRLVTRVFHPDASVGLPRCLAEVEASAAPPVTARDRP